jgi:hypothetical protein
MYIPYLMLGPLPLREFADGTSEVLEEGIVVPSTPYGRDHMDNLPYSLMDNVT